jgi:hypothetical protein
VDESRFRDGIAICRAVARLVRSGVCNNHVPLHLVNAVVSNMKPDQSVIDAIAAKQAASERTAAIEIITTYLAADPTGLRSFVYKWQVLQEIIAKGTPRHTTPPS